jgi:hypothetical protein
MSLFGRHRSYYSHAKKTVAGLRESRFYITEVASWRKIEEGRRRRSYMCFPLIVLLIFIVGPDEKSLSAKGPHFTRGRSLLYIFLFSIINPPFYVTNCVAVSQSNIQPSSLHNSC